MAPHHRANCGAPGITPAQCKARSCCFDDTVVGVPWCFHPAAVDNPPEGTATAAPWGLKASGWEENLTGAQGPGLHAPPCWRPPQGPRVSGPRWSSLRRAGVGPGTQRPGRQSAGQGALFVPVSRHIARCEPMESPGGSLPRLAWGRREGLKGRRACFPLGAAKESLWVFTSEPAVGFSLPCVFFSPLTLQRSAPSRRASGNSARGWNGLVRRPGARPRHRPALGALCIRASARCVDRRHTPLDSKLALRLKEMNVTCVFSFYVCAFFSSQ